MAQFFVNFQKTKIMTACIRANAERVSREIGGNLKT